jgi:release factor glutamine methyltransferase
VVAPLIERAVLLLKPGGMILLEIGSDQEPDVRDLLEAQAELTVAPTVRDHARHPRVLKATKA